MSNPSVYDIAHRASAQSLSVFDEGTLQAKHRAELSRQEAAPQRHIEATARGLPDDLFAEHPEVIHLTREVEIREARAKGLASTTSVAAVNALAQLQEQHEAARDRVSDAAIDDALRSDFEFAGAQAELEAVERLGRQIEAALLATRALCLSPPEKRAFAESAQAARTELQNLLFRLKQEHVRSHPELLG